MFDNCVLYNGINSEVGKIGADLYQEFINQCQRECLAKDYDYFKHNLSETQVAGGEEDHQVFMQDQSSQ